MNPKAGEGTPFHPGDGGTPGVVASLFHFIDANSVYVGWGLLLLALVVFLTWPHLRQRLVDLRNQLLYPSTSSITPDDTESAEGLQLARLAQQERLAEAAKEAQAQRKTKPVRDKKAHLRPDGEHYPLSSWASSSSSSSGGGRNIRFFRAPPCNTGG